MARQRLWIEFDWGRVSYLEWLPQGEPRADVLLLHGGGVDCAELSWGGLGRDLAQAGYRVIAPDHLTCFSSNVAFRGFDQSTPGGSGRWLWI